MYDPKDVTSIRDILDEDGKISTSLHYLGPTEKNLHADWRLHKVCILGVSDLNRLIKDIQEEKGVGYFMELKLRTVEELVNEGGGDE